MWQVVYLPEAEAERRRIKDRSEIKALLIADEKLRELGPLLPYPHASGVRGSDGHGLRELRPRRGNSAWRALFRRIGDVIVIAAICPEAAADPQGFQRGCRLAQARLSRIEED